MATEIVQYPRAAATAPVEPPELAARGEDAEALAERFQALADANRLKVLHLLHTRGEMCACEMQAVLGVTASNLSFHLQVLRHAGFVKPRKEGKWIIYCLAPEQPVGFAREFAALFPGALGVTPRCLCMPEAEPEEGEETCCA